MKRSATLLSFLLFFVVRSFAYSFEANGVYYNITSTSNMTVEVTYYNQSNNKYTGMVGIPGTVTYNGKTYTVTGIGSYAFVGCTGLTGVNFTSKLITTIGERAFSGCNGMTSFSFPDWITSVGNYAFAGCFGITEITFQPTTSTLWLGYGSSKGSAHGLFEDCQLTSVKINRPLNYYIDSKYGYSPFANQAKLKSISFGENVTSIPGNVFYGNNNISTYTVPSHITGLNNYAFNGFGAKSITLNEETETISSYCFSGCTNLTSISIPNGVTSIGDGAFQNSGIKNLVVHPSVKSIGNYVFNGCASLSELTIEESEETLSLGYNYDYGSSSGLGKGLFYDCPLNSVFIGRNLSYNTAKRYGYSPFANNSSLQKARLGNPVSSIQSYLFTNCSSFTTIEYNSKCLPTEIGAYAFYGCKSLTESDIRYPETVKVIGEYAFGNCTSLLGYTIPDHVTTVGNYAYAGCEKLANVIVKPSVKSIGSYVFNGCASLSELTIEESEETLSLGYNYDYGSSSGLGKGLFYDCPLNSVFIGRNLSYNTAKRYGYSPFDSSSLKKARFGNPVTSIPSYLFFNCSNLEELNYNTDCKPTSVGDYAFAGCKTLTQESMGLPVSVKTIGNGAFLNCTGILEYTIPSQITSIGNFAFNGCSSLSSLIIEDSEETLSLGFGSNSGSSNTAGNCLFHDCPLTTVYMGRNLSYNANTQYGYSPFARITSLMIFEIGDKVTSIGSQFLRGCTGIENMVVPEGVTSIGKSAFIDCSGLKNVSLPSTLKTMDQYVFYGCSSLTEITIPASLTSIGSYSFSGCTSITEVTFEDSDETLSLGYGSDSGSSNTAGKSLFFDCPLESVYMGRKISYDSSTRYGYSPFARIPSLHDYVMNERTTYIGAQLLRGCTGIENMVVPEGVTSIGKSAFIDCSGLKNVSLPSTLKTMDTYVFYGCSSLTEMTIPASVTSIGSYSFNGCVGLTFLMIEDSDETLALGYGSDSGSSNVTGSGLFSDCPIETLHLGRSISYETARRYGYSPFLNQTALSKLSFGNGVKTLGMNQFWGCSSLKSVYLPANLNSIYSSTFSGCSSLEQLVCLALNPPTMNGATSFMEGTSEGSRVYVFFVDKYQAAKGWSASYATLTSLGEFNADFTYNGHAQQITYDTSFPIYMSNLETMVDAGTYTKTIELEYHHNGEAYYNSFPYEYVIKKANLTVSADNQTRVYGEENPEFTISFDGFVNGEDESVLSELPVVTTKATQSSNVGSYALTVSKGSATNYSFNYVSGTLTIEKAPQVITWEMEKTDYEVGETIALSATVSSGLALTYTTSDVNILPLSKRNGQVIATCKQKGEAIITVTQAGNDNYLEAEPVSLTFNVAPTRISDIIQDEDADSRMYDLQGREVLTPQQGFYIVNGKKVYFK